jgi:hypothetical protein
MINFLTKKFNYIVEIYSETEKKGKNQIKIDNTKPMEMVEEVEKQQWELRIVKHK